MNPNNIPGIPTDQSVEISDPPVIKMNTQDKIFQEPSPAISHNKMIRAVPNRTAKLVSFLPLETKTAVLIKRSADIFLSSVLIIAILPWLTPVIALLIKLDSKGPIFFLQKRNGRDRKLFTCIKFRTMRPNSESDLRSAATNDPRITRIGKFLRKHHLDELPQLFNVLLGDMSMIGPRPHMIADNLKYQDDIIQYDLRYKVKPGITGLAQVLGYIGPTEDIQQMKDRIQLDIYYIRHWSFKVDVVILLRTFLKMIQL